MRVDEQGSTPGPQHGGFRVGRNAAVALSAREGADPSAEKGVLSVIAGKSDVLHTSSAEGDVSVYLLSILGEESSNNVTAARTKEAYPICAGGKTHAKKP